MALVSCPECNKQISDKAYSCPNCGYPISNFADSKSTNKIESNKSITFYSISNGNETCTFDNGIHDGVKGKCIERMGPFDYYVSGDRLFVTRNAGTVEYIITGKYLINTNGKHNGYIPDKNDFNASCTSKCGYDDIEIIFYDNNTFVETIYLNKSRKSKSKSNGWYMKDGDLLTYVTSFTGGELYGAVVYKNNLYTASLIKAENVQEIRNLLKRARSHCYIKNINKPAKLKKDYQDPVKRNRLAILIIIMIASLIFKDFWILWIIELIIYWSITLGE